MSYRPNPTFKPGVATSGTQKVKTEGRIGSPTPAGRLKGGLDVDNNASAQSHGAGLGAVAGKHLSPNAPGGTWSKRASQARATAATPRKVPK